MAKTVTNLNIQNEKLMSSNETLKNHLEKEYKNTIMLINEKSDVLIDKFIAQRKLNDSEMEFSLLKLEMEKIKNSKTKKGITDEIPEVME